MVFFLFEMPRQILQLEILKIRWNICTIISPIGTSLQLIQFLKLRTALKQPSSELSLARLSVSYNYNRLFFLGGPDAALQMAANLAPTTDIGWSSDLPGALIARDCD